MSHASGFADLSPELSESGMFTFGGDASGTVAAKPMTLPPVHCIEPETTSLNPDRPGASRTNPRYDRGTMTLRSGLVQVPCLLLFHPHLLPRHWLHLQPAAPAAPAAKAKECTRSDRNVGSDSR